MSDSSIAELAQILQSGLILQTPLGLRMGVVLDWNAATGVYGVALAGSSIRVTAYSFGFARGIAVGQAVWIFENGPSLLVVDAVNPESTSLSASRVNFVKPWYTAWGVVANATSVTPTNSGVSGAAADIGLSATWTAVAGRQYEVITTISRAICTVNTTATVLFANGAGVAQSYIAIQLMLANADCQYVGHFLYVPAAGSATIKVQASSSVATAINFQNGGFGSWLTVKDMGPT